MRLRMFLFRFQRSCILGKLCPLVQKTTFLARPTSLGPPFSSFSLDWHPNKKQDLTPPVLPSVPPLFFFPNHAPGPFYRTTPLSASCKPLASPLVSGSFSITRTYFHPSRCFPSVLRARPPNIVPGFVLLAFLLLTSCTFPPHWEIPPSFFFSDVVNPPSVPVSLFIFTIFFSSRPLSSLPLLYLIFFFDA